MDTPRVWSREDILRASEIARVAVPENNEIARSTGLRAVRYVCEVLRFAEDHAVLEVAQPRDEQGRFAKKPALRLDSAIVTAARAGG